MKRLYLRIILGILIILILSFSLPPLIFNLTRPDDRRPQAPIRLEGMSELLISRFRDIPPSQYESALDSLRRFFNYPLQLMDASNKELIDKSHIDNDSGIISGEYESSGGRYFYIPLRAASKVLLMGPVPNRPQPNNPPPNGFPPNQFPSGNMPNQGPVKDAGKMPPSYGFPPNQFQPGNMPDRSPLKDVGKILIMGPMPNPMHSDTKNTIILISVVLSIVGVAGFIIVAPVARDLRILEQAASRFGQGDFDSRALVKSHNNVGNVASQFNFMAESIQQLIQRERQLLQSVSHELRTPISRIRFSLNMLASAGTPEEKERRIREVDGEISEIDQLVGELLDYNRFHSQVVTLDKQSFPVYETVDEIVRRCQDFRPEISIEVSPGPEGNCTVSADRVLFRRAIQNLLANAIRYARSRVTLNFRHDGGLVVVKICDDGPGIPPEMREHILKPFCRVDQSGSKESGGVGLGLAIVSRIVDLHQGNIEISNNDSGGACFTTVWPD